jgi:hypothetical protein
MSAMIRELEPSEIDCEPLASKPQTPTSIWPADRLP